MPTASVTHDFVGGTTIVANDVDQNFTDLVSFINNYCILKDGSVDFTGVPSGPASDPSSDNQLSRKKYVDDRDKALTGRKTAQATSTNTFSSFNSYNGYATATVSGLLVGATVTAIVYGSADFYSWATSDTSFFGKAAVSFDNGGTWTTSTQQVSAFGSLAHPYSGLSIVARFTGTVDASGNVKAQFQIGQRGTGAPTYATANSGVVLDVFREVTIA